ncbi:MAG: hypothetical protein QM765_39880 [Myxococcales bacterium]
MRATALALLLVALPACFQASPESSAGDAATVSPPGLDAGSALPDASDFFASRSRYASAGCDRLAACNLLGLTARADCLAFLEKHSPFHRPATETSVREGLEGFDAVAWQACLSAIAGLPCESVVQASDLVAQVASVCPVEAILPARIAVGGRCLESGNCVGSDVACEKQGCEGTCVSVLRGLGEPCDEAHDCDPSAGACTYLPATGWTCVAWLGAGEACSNEQDAVASCDPASRCDEATQVCVALRGIGEACATSRECHWILRCDPATSLCAEKAREGGPCADSNDCARGFDCRPETGRCEAHWRRMGQSCRPGQGCEGSLCIAGTCEARAGTGDACEPSALLSDCAAGLTCDSASRTCRTLGELGDACDSSARLPQCRLFLACDAGTCSALPRLGESCSTLGYPRCAPPFFCDGLTCQAPQANGAECWSSDECASGFCQSPDEDSDASATCRAACW